jgi:hypothetical protein
MSYLVLPILVYVILTVVTSLEWNSDNGKAWIVLLIKIHDLEAIPGPAEKCPLRIAQGSYSVPTEQGSCISAILISPGKFSTKKCRRSLAMVQIYLENLQA